MKIDRTNNHFLASKKTILLLFIIFSCNNPSREETDSIKEVDNKYSIEGIIHGLDSGWVYFAPLDSAGVLDFTKNDSAQIIDGHFELRGVISSPEPRLLGLRHIFEGKLTGIIFKETIIFDSGNLTLEAHKDSISKMKVLGTTAQKEFNQFKRNIAPINRESNRLYNLITKAKRKHNKELFDSLENVLDNYKKQQEQIIIEHVKQYSSSVISAYIVTTNLYNPDADVLEQLYNFFSENVKSSPYGQHVLKVMKANKRTAIGQLAPEFTIPDKDNKKISLSSYRGKWVLVDFWASWCGPCRAENPNLIKAYTNFHQKGFDILSVSMDSNRKNWLNAVKQDRLTWVQLSDLKASKSSLKELYGINSIPMNFLLDIEGKIIARNLRGEDLQKTLTNLIP